jgi:hypothetical protein
MTLRAIARPINHAPAIAPPARPLYWLIAAIWGVLLPAGYANGLTIDSAFLILLFPVGFLLTGSVVLKRRGLAAIATAIECATVLAVAAFSFVLLSFLLARTGAPYVDPMLDAAERALFPGFDWPSAVKAFCRLAMPLRIANLVYGSLWWQMIVLIVLLCVVGKSARCWDFALAWALSLSLTLAMFAIAPAMGAYSFHHIPHGAVSGVANPVGWRQPVMLEHLRHAATVAVRPQDMLGIVEFPSFHTASAVLLTWGFWAMRPARFVTVPLNLAVLFASVPIGGHYLPDIMGGIIVAMLGIAAMRVWRRFELGDFGQRWGSGNAVDMPLGIHL